MLPIIMCIVCFVYCYRKKQLKEDPNWKMSLPRSGSRATLRNMNSDDERDTIKKSRSYDKVYRTHEPLEGKPNIDFPEKKWDLDDEDITSSDGSEFPASKIASDIEFINQNDPQQKQLGRRSLRMGSDYKPIEEEPNLPPPPLEDSPRSTYSPTYSDLDQNRDSYDPKPINQNQKFQPRPPSGAIRVLPTSSGNAFPFNQAPRSPSSAGSPVPNQDVGLPAAANAKSTEV